MSKTRSDAFDVFNSNSFDEADKQEIADPANSVEKMSAEEPINKPLEVEGDVPFGSQTEEPQNLIEIETRSEKKPLSLRDGGRSLIQKLVPPTFIAIVVGGSIFFIIFLFYPSLLFSSQQYENKRNLQDTQVTQAAATNDLIDGLKNDKQISQSLANEATDRAKALEHKVNTQSDQISQLNAQLQAALLANRQSQVTISDLTNKLLVMDKGNKEPSFKDAKQKISSTKFYAGVVISSIYRGQVWLREGQKMSVLTEGDSFRGSQITEIDPTTRTVITTKGIIK